MPAITEDAMRIIKLIGGLTSATTGANPPANLAKKLTYPIAEDFRTVGNKRAIPI